MAFSIQREPAFQQDPLFKIAVKNHGRVYTKPGEIKYFDKNLYYTVPIQAEGEGGGGGTSTSFVRGCGHRVGKLTHPQL